MLQREYLRIHNRTRGRSFRILPSIRRHSGPHSLRCILLSTRTSIPRNPRYSTQSQRSLPLPSALRRPRIPLPRPWRSALRRRTAGCSGTRTHWPRCCTGRWAWHSLRIDRNRCRQRCNRGHRIRCSLARRRPFRCRSRRTPQRNPWQEECTPWRSTAARTCPRRTGREACCSNRRCAGPRTASS